MRKILAVLIEILVVTVIILVGFYLYKNNYASEQKINKEGVCADFDSISNLTLKYVKDADSKLAQFENRSGEGHFLWLRKQNEPFITYPAIKQTYLGINVVDNNQNKANRDFAIENISRDLTSLAQQLNFIKDDLNNGPLKTYGLLSTKIFGYRKGISLYSINISMGESSNMAPGGITFTVSCGVSTKEHDQMYDLLNINADLSTVGVGHDYISIREFSEDKKVFLLIGSRNYMGNDVARYYYHDGNKLNLVSTTTTLIKCSAFESRRIGKGMMCEEEGSGHWRRVKY